VDQLNLRPSGGDFASKLAFSPVLATLIIDRLARTALQQNTAETGYSTEVTPPPPAIGPTGEDRN